MTWGCNRMCNHSVKIAPAISFVSIIAARSRFSERLVGWITGLCSEFPALVYVAGFDADGCGSTS